MSYSHKKFIYHTVTFCGVGSHAPRVPGTFGSLAAIVPGTLLLYLGGFPALFIATLLVFGLGWYATSQYIQGLKNKDASEIVVDEVIGMWIAMMPINLDLSSVILAFVLFRFFDIAKPWPVSWADRKHNTFGIIFDDVLAGLLSALCVNIIYEQRLFYDLGIY